MPAAAMPCSSRCCFPAEVSCAPAAPSTPCTAAAPSAASGPAERERITQDTRQLATLYHHKPKHWSADAPAPTCRCGSRSPQSRCCCSRRRRRTRRCACACPRPLPASRGPVLAESCSRRSWGLCRFDAGFGCAFKSSSRTNRAMVLMPWTRKADWDTNRRATRDPPSPIIGRGERAGHRSVSSFFSFLEGFPSIAPAGSRSFGQFQPPGQSTR
jgi:hypothetical protein